MAMEGVERMRRWEIPNSFSRGVYERNREDRR